MRGTIHINTFITNVAITNVQHGMSNVVSQIYAKYIYSKNYYLFKIHYTYNNNINIGIEYK